MATPACAASLLESVFDYGFCAAYLPASLRDFEACLRALGTTMRHMSPGQGGVLHVGRNHRAYCAIMLAYRFKHSMVNARSPLWCIFWKYLCEALLLGIILFFLLDLSHRDLKVPFLFSGDALHHLLITKALTEQSWVAHIRRLSAPYELPMVVFPVNGNLGYLGLRIVTLFTHEPGLALNIYWLVLIGITALSCTWSLDRLKVKPSISFVLGLLYALLPFTFYRNEAHIMLMPYLIPPVAALAVRIFRAQGFTRWERTVFFASCFLVGCGYSYGAFFAAFISGAAGILGSMKAKSLMPIRTTAVAVSIIVVTFGLNLLPTALAWRQDGEARENILTGKTVTEADVYGLKLRQLIIPAEHHFLPPLARLEQLYRTTTFPFENENTWAKLCTVGSLGLLVLLVAILVGYSESLQRELAPLASLTLVCILLSVVGGFGSLFNVLVSPDIRAYNRIFVFIAFYCFAAAGVMFSWFIARWTVDVRFSRALSYVGCAALLLFGLFDQRNTQTLNANYPFERTQYYSLKEYVGRIEATLDGDAPMVFQLPALTYPSTPNNFQEHIAPYIVSKRIRWSYPALSGEAIQWNRKATGFPLANLPVWLSSAGFAGIWVDGAGYEDKGRAVVSALTSSVGQEPFWSMNGRYAFFRLDRFRTRQRDMIREIQDGTSSLLLYSWGEVISFDGKYNAARFLGTGWSEQGNGYRWTTGKRVTIDFSVRPVVGDRVLTVSVFNFLPYKRFPVTVSIDNTIVGTWEMSLTGAPPCPSCAPPYTMTIPSVLVAGKRKFTLAFDTPLVTSPQKLGVNTDTRILGMAVREVQLK